MIRLISLFYVMHHFYIVTLRQAENSRKYGKYMDELNVQDDEPLCKLGPRQLDD